MLPDSIPAVFGVDQIRLDKLGPDKYTLLNFVLPKLLISNGEFCDEKNNPLHLLAACSRPASGSL
jgi:hypothetical protein